MSQITCINSAIGFRDAPPVSPECVSTAPVSSLRMNPSSPRKPAELAGRSRETQTVSETTTESVRRFFAALVMIFSNVICMAGVDRHCGRFYKTAQQCFEFVPVRLGKRQKTIPLQWCGHSKILRRTVGAELAG